jgi:hypothetical protein
MISKHIALTITTNEVSDWAQEEFCQYLTENATIHEFVWCASEVDSLTVQYIEPNTYKLEFNFKGYVYDWIDDPESHIIDHITNTYLNIPTEIYMGIEPIIYTVISVTLQ